MAVVWGKSDAQGSPHLLLGHLLDTAAVGELIWDRFLAPVVKGHLDEVSGGRGRSLFALLCGLHDVGKATPAFQSKDGALAVRVQAAGLGWRPLSRNRVSAWHHTKAGAAIVRSRLAGAGWSSESCEWVWPLIAGHHGVVPAIGCLWQPPRDAHGRGAAWRQVQDGIVDRVAEDLGLDLGSFAGLGMPRRGGQLAVSGLIIMADWIASDEQHFRGLPDLAAISMDEARSRAVSAWERLGLRGGWRPASLVPCASAELVEHRFGVPARSAQAAAVELAEQMPAPGLLILEAPMGEGKTEAALAAAEVLARRFGADGLFVGMPTQATSDPMFGRVREWLTAVDSEVPLGLLHGRARFNKEWAALRAPVRFVGVADDQDEYGLGDVYGSAGQNGGAEDRPVGDGMAAADWFFGPKRGLLAPVTVGTVDQLLHAATRTKHVMVRHAGLAGRVVVLDEVHAYDVYMSQFLFEALRWLADTGVPVVLLSATLPPALRHKLISAYAQGASRQREVDLGDVPAPSGYPSTTAVCVVEGKVDGAVEASLPWRESSPVVVEVLDETDTFEPRTVADRVLAEVAREDATTSADQPLGCVLVVCNTVARAQDVYAALAPALGDDVVLLHSRFVAAERARRTEEVVNQLGRPGRLEGARRPRRLVVVATQVAEQSFDVDVDLLITDLAPIDLLLQRVGRLHRHQRPEEDRPAHLRQPRVVVSGLRRYPGNQPSAFPPGSRAVYGNHLLLRSAALVLEAVAMDGWSVPAAVPRLVATGYDDTPLGPPEWARAVAKAKDAWAEREQRREANARGFLLAGEDFLGASTLDGLHERSTAALATEERVAAVVRDGDESVEVVLVRRDVAGFRTLGGTWLGPNGEVPVHDDTVLEEVVGATIRLPAYQDLTAAALSDLRPLPAWIGDGRDRRHDPWLRRSRALVVEDGPAEGVLTARLGERRLTYHHDLGLRVVKL
ncbi:CRISPR-associated helicase Cas3' [Frankia nepalensis]|nr:CRISPR-associated helicase Cas3' [Frankia nepalensis]